MTTPRLATALALAGLLGVARAQEPPAPPADPFATPSSMRRAQADGTIGPVGSRSLLAGLPAVTVLGTIEVAGRPAGALLAVGDLRRVVRGGDRLALVAGGLEVTLEVQAIEGGAVHVRVGGPEGQLLVLR